MSDTTKATHDTAPAIDGTVSHGTMRTQDLIPAFLDVLRELDPDRYAGFCVQPFGPVPSHAAEDSDSDWWGSDDAGYLLEELFDALGDCAPEGYYFGAHPGDGSDYGFWAEEG